MRRFGRMAQGAKGSAMSVVTGGAVGLASGYALSAVPWLGQAWWTMPAALALLGHFLRRKNPTVGGALLGVGGYWAYTGFMANKSAVAGARGFVDAGFIDAGYPAGRYAPGGSDAGAFTTYNDNIGTSASPSMGTAQAAMLMSGGATAMGMDDTAELMNEAYGLSD
jgi:hypothetical protein